MQNQNGQTYSAIQEVADMLGISKSLIRFWEEEFNLPRRENGLLNRLEMEQIRVINTLITEREMPLEEAKIAFAYEKRLEVKHRTLDRLIEIRASLLTLKDQISS